MNKTFLKKNNTRRTHKFLIKQFNSGEFWPSKQKFNNYVCQAKTLCKQRKRRRRGDDMYWSSQNNMCDFKLQIFVQCIIGISIDGWASLDLFIAKF